MIITREKHWQFLEDEITEHTRKFEAKFSAKATYLYENGELFTGRFVSFKEDSGEMIAKFPRSKAPGKGEFLYCMWLPKRFRDRRDWGQVTYEEMYAERYKGTECNCIWCVPDKEKPEDYCLAGFRRVDREFEDKIKSAPGCILVFAPKRPPLEYMASLQRLVRDAPEGRISSILDADYKHTDWKPSLITGNALEFVKKQLSLSDTMILQGPPGTGKTYLIAELCAWLCSENKSVMVTANTNRALMEVAHKPALESMLKEKKVMKVNLSSDESRELRELLPISAKSITPSSGCLVLSTFYNSSSYAAIYSEDSYFDYVIVDEASQAFMGMFAAAVRIGKVNLWVGDVHQMPPIVEINEDYVKERGYSPLVNGFELMTTSSFYPIYQLTDTYRLGKRAAEYTGIFYGDTLKSASGGNPHPYPSAADFISSGEGPSIVLEHLPLSDKSPELATRKAAMIVDAILHDDKSKEIAVLSIFLSTVRSLRRAIRQDSVTVSTVDKSQGLTKDIVILVIPNTTYAFSLEPRRFNVATSRAREHTIIIADADILNHPRMNDNVRKFLERLCGEQKERLCEQEEDSSPQPPAASAATPNEEPITEAPAVQTSEPGLTVIGTVDLSQFISPARKAVESGTKKNVYVIDTNVFVNYPNIISKIDSCYGIAVSAKVIDELDNLKIKQTTPKGKNNVNNALKNINRALKEDKRVEAVISDTSLLPKDFKAGSPDNMILSVAMKLRSEAVNPILLTSDNGLQGKARVVGIGTITLKEFLG